MYIITMLTRPAHLATWRSTIYSFKEEAQLRRTDRHLSTA